MMKPKRKAPATAFGGPRGNIPGKTGLQRELEIENAKTATEIRGRVLERLKQRLVDDAAIDAVLDKLNLNSLLKDSEDRGLGTPKGSVDVTTNGKDLPGAINLKDLSSEALSELVAAKDAATKAD